MSGFKDFAKGGWHPKGKDGGKESWRGDFKGIDTVAGWMGKKKTGSSEDAHDHHSTPLNQLKDPASFGPPPKRATGGLSSPTSPAAPSTEITPRIHKDTGGLGAPLSRNIVEEDKRLAQERLGAIRQEEEEPKYPTGPYRADTTGLSTANLPKPPVFKGNRGTEAETQAAPKPKPSLPPRLPPRGAAVPTTPPPAYNALPAQESGVLNQGAVNRLGAAGVSVSEFGIGGPAASPSLPSKSSTTSPPVPSRAGGALSPPPNGPQLSELQSRFSRLNTGSPASEAPSTGTTWAQKQAALKTASQFQKDPSSISMADARDTASTANNFRQRHGEQVASGWRAASNLNQKYGLSDRVQGYTGGATPPADHEPANADISNGPGSPGSGTGKKKPPPPPPAKKRELQGGPPPIPVGSKPSIS